MEEHRAKATMVFHRPRSGGSMEKIVPKGDFFHRAPATSSLGLRKRNLSDLPNHPKYKLIFPLSLIPKLLVACVGRSFFYSIITVLSLYNQYLVLSLNCVSNSDFEILNARKNQLRYWILYSEFKSSSNLGS